MIRLAEAPSTETPLPMTIPNSLRGEFTVPIGGTPAGFDTTLGTVARIEELCGGAILEVVNRVVTGRRAADQMALLSGALKAGGRSAEEAEALAERATVPEAEAFILALMGALGFALTPEPQEGRDPLDGSPAGDGGGNSPSAA